MKETKVAIIYPGEWKPTVRVRAAVCKNGTEAAAKGETVDKTITVNTEQRAIVQRGEVWQKVLYNPRKKRDDDEEVGTLVYSLNAYAAVCRALDIFALDDDWSAYEYTVLNVATQKDYDLLCDTLAETFGPKSADVQRKALSPEGRAAWDAKRGGQKKPVKEPDLPKLAPLKLPVESKTPSVKEIVGNYTMIVLTIHGIGNRRKVDTGLIQFKDESVEEEADKTWFGVSKKLLESPELREINYIAAKCREYVEMRSLPSLIKKGIHIQNRETVSLTIEKIKEANAEIQKKAVVLKDAYPRLMAEAQGRLKKRFNPKDYPSVEELKERFYISYQLLEIKAPEPEKLEAKVFREEKAKWEKVWTEAAKNAEQLLCAGLTEQLQSLIDKLTPGADGKKKQIRDSALDNINEFLATFNPRNMQNNAQLNALAERAKQMIKGMDPEVLRQSKNAREYVATGFQQIQKALEPMVINKPRRRITFEDEV